MDIFINERKFSTEYMENLEKKLDVSLARNVTIEKQISSL